MEVYQNEVFGPVLQVLNAATLDEAIALLRSRRKSGDVIF